MTMPTARTMLTALTLTALSTCALADWAKVNVSDDGKITTYADPATTLTLGAKVLAIESVESQGAATVFLVLCIIVAVIGLGLGKAMKS